MTTKSPAGSATGIDLAPCPFCGSAAHFDDKRTHATCVECSFLPWLYVEEWNRRAAPQDSVTEQASIDTPEFRSLMDEFEKSVGRSTLERDDAEFAIIRHIDARAKPLASTEATQPEQANAMACGQCFGKGVIANIGETCDLCNGSGLESCDCGTHTKSACDLAGACGPKDGTALTHRATTADEQATHLTDEGHQASIASFMTTPGFKEALAELAADQQGDTASVRFADWLAREMPAGTVISDPAWWAPRILRAAQHGAAQAQASDDTRPVRVLSKDEAVVSAAAYDVLAERYRQVEAEGWTPEHDDAHNAGAMVVAAACYALQGDAIDAVPPEAWPWAMKWWKPAGARRNLIKAGALILAEIERIDRAAMAAPATSGGGNADQT